MCYKFVLVQWKDFKKVAYDQQQFNCHLPKLMESPKIREFYFALWFWAMFCYDGSCWKKYLEVFDKIDFIKFKSRSKLTCEEIITNHLVDLKNKH